MLRASIISIVSTLLISATRIPAQNGFVSAYYEINGGEYAECCGFAGPFIYSLPDERQGVVELIIDSSGRSARLTFLAPDMFTVFTSYAAPPNSGFAFTFSNGIVSSNQILFSSGPPPAPMDLWSYSVTNRNGTLGINGRVITPRAGADLPNDFKHTNVVATRISSAVLIDELRQEGDSVRFHFAGPPPYDYTVEATGSLSSPEWTAIGTYRAKLQTIDVTVAQPAGDAARFFRIRQQPCGCR